MRAEIARHAGRDAVRASCAGAELDLVLEVGLTVRACAGGGRGVAALAVTAPRVEANAVDPRFWPVGPTFRVEGQGPLRLGFATERYTLRPGQRPVLIALGPAGVAVHEARFEAQRFSAMLTGAEGARLQFGLLPASVTGDGGVRSAAP